MSFEDIAAAIDDYVGSEGPASLCDEQPRRMFSDVVADGHHVAKLNEVVARLDTPEVIGMVGSRDYIILRTTEHTTWAFTRSKEVTATISLTPVLSMSAKIGGAPCVVETLSPDRALTNEVFEPSAHLTLQERAVWENGAILSKPSIEIVHRFVFDGEDGPVYLRVNSALQGDFEWVFDASDGRARRHVCVRPGESNLVTMLDLISDVGSSSSLDYVLPFVASRLHFVRWKAIATACRIDASTGMELVRRAVDDPHPDVRRAARRTLAMDVQA